VNKEEMIKTLVAYSVKAALSESKPYWLSELFENGFAGYRNMSRTQLARELQMRGLDEEGIDQESDPYEEDLPEDFEDIDFDGYGDAELNRPLRMAGAE